MALFTEVQVVYIPLANNSFLGLYPQETCPCVLGAVPSSVRCSSTCNDKDGDTNNGMEKEIVVLSQQNINAEAKINYSHLQQQDILRSCVIRIVFI